MEITQTEIWKPVKGFDHYEVSDKGNEHDYTQFELAWEVGVSVSTIKVWEADRQTPKRENLKRLKAVLGIGEPEPTDKEKERERELRIYYMRRMDAKTDNWCNLKDNDPDLVALRELMM